MLKIRFTDSIYLPEVANISPDAMKVLAEKAGELLALNLAQQVRPEDKRIEITFTFFTE